MKSKRTELEQSLLDSMEYVESTDICRNCTNYVPTDCSGDRNAKSEHCTLNPSMKIFGIDPEGRCSFFTPKEDLMEKRP